MKEIILEYLPQILALLVGVSGSVAAYLISRYKLKKQQNELEVKRIDLEVDKLNLERSMYQSSYIQCPHCNSKIELKDMNFKVRE